MKEDKNYETESTVQSIEVKKEIKDVPSVRLSPEQIEEINADDYSLLLFNATRVQPLSLSELKRYFVETEPKKAESVMERFLKTGLIHKTEEGKYFSNFPDNYINYSDYRYDSDLEVKKDSKVFQLMKEFTGKKEYWKDKTYFSIDAFFTDEQSKELIEMLKEVKLKAKQFSNENDKIGIKGMKFRRLKFYDMFWLFALFMLTFTFSAITPSSSAFAKKGSGNDPVGMAFISNDLGENEIAKHSGGSGNDPTSSFFDLEELAKTGGGGGHDPENTIECKIRIGNRTFIGVLNLQTKSCEMITE